MKTKVVILGMLSLLSTQFAAALSIQVPTYSDVNSNTYYFDSINWAVVNGIATGYDDGRWGPDDCVTRAQLMKMIVVATDGSYGEVIPTKVFKDVKAGDWFVDYVTIGYNNNWIKGYADGTFKPNKCVNRAEAMKMATNAMFANPNLDSSGGPVMYDDKIVADIKISDWFGPFSRFLFKDRLVGTYHTRFSGEVGGATAINFYPSESMSRKEVAAMLHRISVKINGGSISW